MRAVAPLLTWLVVLGEFLLNLGGLHPSDARRDLNLAVGAVVLLALQVPLVLRWVRLARANGPGGLPRREIALTLVRLGVATYIFWFIHSVSHSA
jgi:hypothetical protein